MKMYSSPLFFTLLFFCLLHFFLTDLLKAQFTLEGEIRPRTEYRHGFKTLPVSSMDPAFFTEQRSRLSLVFVDEMFELGFTLQDVRIWGSVDQLTKSDGFSSIHEAWGKVNLTDEISLKAGRQELVYDDERILGNVNWTAQGRSHDAFIMAAEGSGHKLHLGLAYNQTNDPAEPVKLFGTYYSGINNYKTLQYAWYQKQANDFIGSLLILNNGIQVPDSTVNFTQTIGANLQYSFENGIHIKGSVYHQRGKDPHDASVATWLASLEASRSFNLLTLTAGADYLSGTKADDTKNRSFDPLYGTHHKFYGFMDYFYVGHPHRQPVSGHSLNVGLTDLYLKSAFKFTDAFTIQLHVHQYISPVDILDPVDPARNISRFLGREVDVVFNVHLQSAVTLQAGYSQMFANRSLEILKNGDRNVTSNWGWLMLRFHPVLFTTTPQ
jgi:hypothetical protein